MLVKDLIERLTRNHKEDDAIAATLWIVDDVLGLAGQMGVALTPEQAADVLELAEDEFDANIGISWDVLEIHIQTILHYDEGQE